MTIIRRTPNNQQVVIRVDLNRALRDPRENMLIHPGDVLVLQETPSEAVSRYFATTFNFGIFSQVWQRAVPQPAKRRLTCRSESWVA